MEYAGEYLTKQNMPKNYEEQIKNIIVVLNQYRCSHNDIKPSELLILDGRIKLIDFGLAKRVIPNEIMNKPNGTPYYIAPEVLKGSYTT